MNTGRHCLKVTKKSPQGRKEKYCYEEWKLTKFLLFDVYYPVIHTDVIVVSDLYVQI